MASHGLLWWMEQPGVWPEWSWGWMTRPGLRAAVVRLVVTKGKWWAWTPRYNLEVSPRLIGALVDRLGGEVAITGKELRGALEAGMEIENTVGGGLVVRLRNPRAG